MRALPMLLSLITLSAAACATGSGSGSEDVRTAALTADTTGLSHATFAGGCFWCMEPPYDALDGVVATTAGYMGGHTQNPTYDEVVRGGTGHFEVVRVTYDSTRVSYEELLDVFWRNIDPVQAEGQFCDIGSQYRSAIFAGTERERHLAEESREELRASGRLGPKQIATEIRDVATFYRAEDYHQDFYKKYPAQYQAYRIGCARDARLKELWRE